MNRYRFHKSDGGFGQELWIWIMWASMLLSIIISGMFTIGFINGAKVERSFLMPLVRGMTTELEHACEKRKEEPIRVPQGVIQ